MRFTFDSWPTVQILSVRWLTTMLYASYTKHNSLTKKTIIHPSPSTAKGVEGTPSRPEEGFALINANSPRMHTTITFQSQ